MPGTLEDYAVAVGDVISICRDAEQGFRGAANAAKTPALADTLVRYSEQYACFAAEIQAALKSMGFDPTYPLGVAGVLRAGWVRLKAFMDGHDEHGIWVEVGHIVNRTVKTYGQALDKSLPVGIRTLLEKQYEEIKQMDVHVKGRYEVSAPSTSAQSITEPATPPKTTHPEEGKRFAETEPPSAKSHDFKGARMTIREVMTPHPVTFQASTPVTDAARAMREYNMGDVVVKQDGKLCGIVTDRDIVIRVLGAGKDPSSTDLGSIRTHPLLTISPDQSTSEAVELMRERAVRRLPVLENDTVIGIVSLGDLAARLDRRSALGAISAAQPNQ